MSKCDLKKNIYFQFTILFMITGFFVFFWFLAGGKTLLMQADGFTQQYPIVVHLRHSLGELLRGHGFSFWNWSTGLGADKIANYSPYYFDPFTYVMAIFPPAKMDIGYGVAMYLRLYTAGLFMLLYLKRNQLERFQCLIGALSYSYFMWVYAAGGQMSFFIPMITFPLLIMSIDEFDRSGKPFMLTLLTGYLIGITPYFAYMMAFIAGLYAIVKYFYLDRKKSILDFLKRFGLLAGSIGLGMLLFAPLISIVLTALIHSPKGEESFSVDIVYSLKEAILMIPAFFTDHQFIKNYSCMTLCAVILAMFPALVMNLRDKKEKQTRLYTVMFFICLIILSFPVFGSVLNGFNYPHARWIFMLQFFLITAACKVLSPAQFEVKTYRRAFLNGFVLYCCVVGFVICVAAFFQLLTASNLILALINFAIMFFTVLTLIYPVDKEVADLRKKALVLLCVVGICAPYFYYFYPILTGGFSDRMNEGMTYKIFQRSILKGMDTFEDEFYRVDINNHVNGHTDEGYADYYHYISNDNVYYNIPTVYYYVSTIDSCLYEFNTLMGNNDGTTTRVISFSNDGRARLDFLQDVQYIASIPDDQKEVRNYAFTADPSLSNDNRVIFKNRWDVSLGYVYPGYITESEFLEKTPLAREQALMQAAVVSDDYQGGASRLDPKALTDDTKELEYTIEKTDNVKINGNIIRVSKAKGYIDLRFEDLEDCELYVFIENLNRIPVTYEDLKKQNIKEDTTLREKAQFLYKNLLHEPAENFELYIVKDSRRERLMDYTGQNNQAVLATTDYLRNMGYYKKADGTVRLQFYTAGTYSFDSLKIYTVSAKNFDEQADRLVSNRMNVTEVGNDVIRGNVDSEGGILYLSILDSGGWKAYVDGKQTPLKTVNTAFIGLDVEPGYHDIELRYTPVGWPYAWIGTGIGVLSFIGLIFLFRRKANGNDGDRQPIKEKASGKVQASVKDNENGKKTASGSDKGDKSK